MFFGAVPHDSLRRRACCADGAANTRKTLPAKCAEKAPVTGQPLKLLHAFRVKLRAVGLCPALQRRVGIGPQAISGRRPLRHRTRRESEEGGGGCRKKPQPNTLYSTQARPTTFTVRLSSGRKCIQDCFYSFELRAKIRARFLST